MMKHDSSQKGSIIIAAIVFLVVVAAAAAGISHLAFSSAMVSTERVDSERAFYAAESARLMELDDGEDRDLGNNNDLGADRDGNIYRGWVGDSWDDARARHAIEHTSGVGVGGSAENQLLAGEEDIEHLSDEAPHEETKEIWEANKGEIDDTTGNIIASESPGNSDTAKMKKLDDFKEYLEDWEDWYNDELETNIELTDSAPQRMTIITKGVDESKTPTFGPGQSPHNVKGEFRDHNFYDEDLQVITFDFAAHDPPGQGNNPKWGEWNAFGDGNNQLRITPENEEATIQAGFFDNEEDDILENYSESLNEGGSGGGTGSWSYSRE